jgi:hypothetical protein
MPARCWPPSIFHFGQHSLAEARAALAAAGLPVRAAA